MKVPPSPVFLKAQGLLIIWCVLIFLFFMARIPPTFWKPFCPILWLWPRMRNSRWCQMTDGVGTRFPAGGGASERASRQTAARSPLACASLSEAPTPDARKALSFQHHQLRLRREDSWPSSSSSSNWLESALTPQECSTVSRLLFLL